MSMFITKETDKCADKDNKTDNQLCIHEVTLSYSALRLLYL